MSRLADGGANGKCQGHPIRAGFDAGNIEDLHGLAGAADLDRHAGRTVEHKRLIDASENGDKLPHRHETRIGAPGDVLDLKDGLSPAVRIAAAIEGGESGGFDFSDVVAGLDGPAGIGQYQWQGLAPNKGGTQALQVEVGLEKRGDVEVHGRYHHLNVSRIIEMKMDEKQALDAFGALSQDTRLRIVRTLVIAGEGGLSAGAISEAVGSSSSRASFHLAHLERAGLIASRREARSIIYTANFAGLAGLVDFLLRDCCQGHPAMAAGVTDAAQACCAPG